MKILKSTIIFILPIASILLISGCTKSFLKENLYSQLAPDNFLTTNDGIKSLLHAAYANEGQVAGQSADKGIICMQELTTDLMYETGGF